MNAEYVKSILRVLNEIPNKIVEWDAMPGALDHTCINLKILVPSVARDSITAIKYLQKENEQLRERLRTDILDYIHRLNYANLQLELSQKALKEAKQQGWLRDDQK